MTKTLTTPLASSVELNAASGLSHRLELSITQTWLATTFHRNSTLLITKPVLEYLSKNFLQKLTQYLDKCRMQNTTSRLRTLLNAIAQYHSHLEERSK